jgi:hypothetical protein
MNKPIYIKFVNLGIANRFEFEDHSLIEMNKRLKMYPELFNAVLMHELGHDDSTTMEDFKHDMKSKTPGLFRFMSRHLSAWTQILPFYWDIKRNKLVYDISYIASWFMIAGTALAVFFLMKFVMGFVL